MPYSVTLKELVAAFWELGPAGKSMKAMSKAEFREERLLSNRRRSLPPWIRCADDVSAASEVDTRVAFQLVFPPALHGLRNN